MNKKSIRIGIVGCGAIGSSIAQAIVEDFSPQAKLSAVLDIQKNKAVDLANRLQDKKIIASDLKDLILRSDLVVEATTAESSYRIALRSISFKKDVMVMSVAGILERFFELRQLAEKKKVRLLIPSGAICGLDAVKAVALDKIRRVVLTTYKPPFAFKGNKYILKKRINLNRIKENTLLFKGSVYDAVKLFPQNVNVCATLSMAVGNPHLIEVNIIASIQSKNNIHEVLIDSEAGRIITRCENVAHPNNPKTSFLAVLSALAVLKEYLELTRIGT